MKRVFIAPPEVQVPREIILVVARPFPFILRASLSHSVLGYFVHMKLRGLKNTKYKIIYNEFDFKFMTKLAY